MAISQRQYRRYPESYWFGKHVRSLTVLGNVRADFPVGTVFEIVGKSSGFLLETAPCSKCGISHRLTRVDPENLELVAPGCDP